MSMRFAKWLSKSRQNSAASLRALVLGHRGGRGEGWPTENTLASISKARGEGADGVEIDVRLCATGEVVVFHDANLSRATNGSDTRAVSDVSWPELTRRNVPRLLEVLDYCRDHELWLNVEIKYDVPNKHALARAVATELRHVQKQLVVSSFDPRLLWMVRAMGVRAPRAWLTDQKQRHVSTLLQLAVRRPLVHGAHLEHTQATPERVAMMLRRGLFVGVWTVNDPAEARALSHQGVRFLITDQPAIIRAALD